MIDHNYYNKYGGGYFSKFIERNKEFDTKIFRDYMTSHNKGDRDSGELQDIAKHEVLRLAYEFTEKMWRFPNVYGKHLE